MSQEFAALQGGLPAANGFDEAVFFLEVARDNVLHDHVPI
jgi:hypothetical protein